ncbi:MAG: hypothetical protein K2N58_08935 [Treponemataceae bacterium]|nr:hypothetical protein [Treponemataceae bacterium]
MKRIVSGFIACMALLLALFVAGCANNPLPDDSKNNGGNGSGDTGDKTENLNRVDTIEKVSANPDYLSDVESFYDAENDYWIFNMGTISNVPLETPTFFYYGGKGEIKQTFTKASTTVSSVSSTVQSVVEDKMSWGENWSVEASLSAGKKASISGKLSGSMESEKTTTETKSYSEFIEWTNTLKKEVTINFDERYKAGYYAYLVSATVKVYAVLVKDRSTGAVSVGTYNELISKEYSFAYNEFDNKLSVDKKEKFEFDPPDVESLSTPTYFVCREGYTAIKDTQGFKDIGKNLSGKYVLLNDLDFGGAQITPIGGSSGRFSGVIVGNGHTISNFSVSADYPFAGLIARNAGKIENVQIRDANISVSRTGADAFAGVVAGENTGTISNCSVSGGSVKVSAVDNNNTENSSRYAVAGGIAGKISDDGTIENCSVESVLLYGFAKKHDKAWSEGWNEVAFVYVGGVVGEQLGGNVLYNTTTSLEIKGEAEYRSNALVTATTRSRICLGGIIGRRSDSVLSNLDNTNTASSPSFKHSFNSYNEINGVKKIEEYYAEKNVGYAD